MPALKNISITLGAITALAPQLAVHGLTKAEIKVFEDDNSALNRAYIRDFITESQIKAARKKLAKKITDYIRKVRTERGEIV